LKTDSDGIYKRQAYFGNNQITTIAIKVTSVEER
jgi:hypothetical protein